MLQVVKRIWVRGLTSGQHKQGRGFLHSHGRYCCLGVLRKVAELGKDSHDGHGGSLSLQQLRDVGLTKRQQDTLIQLNDKKKFSFREIAAWIKENL